MLKASLSLDKFKERGIKADMALDLAHTWKEMPAVRLWLRARGFNIDKQILVLKENEEMVFFQRSSIVNRSVIIVNQDAVQLETLTKAFSEVGHKVIACTSTRMAIQKINSILDLKGVLDFVIFPKNLQVSQFTSFELYMKTHYPELKVLSFGSAAQAVEKVEEEPGLTHKEMLIQHKQNMRIQDIRDEGRRIRIQKLLKVAKGQTRSPIPKQVEFIDRNLELLEEIFTTTNRQYRKQLFKDLKHKASVFRYDLTLHELRSLWKRFKGVK